MPLPFFPKECFDNVLIFLDKSTLYNFLFINRNLCRLTIPIIWKNPFSCIEPKLISTLLACINKEEVDEFFLSTFCALNFKNNQIPLFEYGKFIEVIHHKYLVKSIETWFDESRKKKKKRSKRENLNGKIQNLVDVIY